MSRKAAFTCGLALLLAGRIHAQNDSASIPPAPAVSTAQSTSGTPVSPLRHLTDARNTLAGISEKPLPTRTRKNLAQLRKDSDAMAKSYKDAPADFATWQNAMYDVERDLTVLTGGGGLDVAAEEKAIPGLPAEVSDPPARKGLETYRTQLELFYDAATAFHVLAPAGTSRVP